MTKFIYRAKKSPGEFIDGTVEADSLENAVDKLGRMGYVPLDISPQLENVPLPRPSAAKAKNLPVFTVRRIKSFDIVVFTRQMYDLIDAGVPLMRALNVVLRQTQNPSLKEIITKMSASIQDGGTLSSGLAQYPQVFSPLYVNMVKSGEISGNLNVVLGRLAEFTDKDQETRNKIRASLVYPALMLLVGAITIFVLLTFVIPRLTAMFDDLSETLPLPTLILIAVSDFMLRFWWLLAGMFALIGFYFKGFLHTSEGRLKFDTFKLKVPVLGNFIRDVEIGRFSRTLGTLLDSGIVIVPALESVWAVLENTVLKAEIEKVSREVADGMSLTAALKKCVYFPEEAINMIAVGEESGHLEHSLYKLADSYQRQSERTMKTITSLLEPLMIVGIGSVVGFIVMAMLLPIFKMNLIIK